MPDAGKKRSYDEEDEPSGKKSRDNGDSKDNAVHVYQPCVVLPELAGKMNSLVEVCLAALVLAAGSILVGLVAAGVGYGIGTVGTYG